ncbi:hypothetical protein Enr13x_26380 [Stieleria neptunia]|uniref:Uncharacterized protein n=1 Tax=Stieleria neptunia TaxID=2527979 RepID=A0A518HPM0_9BACT|nr:hypothetical protein Enr13x_26380 [Stieleria neptunia]
MRAEPASASPGFASLPNTTIGHRSHPSKNLPRVFESEDEGVSGDAGILIVKNMLLTGFDAPVEQVMYRVRCERERPIAGRGCSLEANTGPDTIEQGAIILQSCDRCPSR